MRRASGHPKTVASGAVAIVGGAAMNAHDGVLLVVVGTAALLLWLVWWGGDVVAFR